MIKLCIKNAFSPKLGFMIGGFEQNLERLKIRYDQVFHLKS